MSDLGVIARRMAREHPTPFYVIDVKQIRSNANALRSAWAEVFPGARCMYSYKTNPLSAICRQLRALGYGAEVVSDMELRWAISDGFVGADIALNGPAKTRAEIALAAGVGATIQVDGCRDVRLVRDAALSAPSEIRLVARIATDVRGEYSRFGMTPAELDEATSMIRGIGLTWHGVHVHLGGIVRDAGRHISAICDSARLLRDIIMERGSVVLNLGGGFGPASAAELQRSTRPIAQAIHQALFALEVDSKCVVVTLEPGRSIVEKAAALVANVLSVKERTDCRIATLNVASNLLPTRCYRTHPIDFGRGPLEASYLLAGPQCFEDDIIVRDALGLPIWATATFCR